jgi:hypothetical protein
VQQKESLLLSTSATFDMTFPTSPQRVAAASSAQITKDYFANPENRDEKANLPWQVLSWPFSVLFLRLLAPLTLDHLTRLPVCVCVCVCVCVRACVRVCVRARVHAIACQAKCYFDKHYDPLVLPPVVKQYFTLNPVEAPPEKAGKKGKKSKKKK